MKPKTALLAGTAALLAAAALLTPSVISSLTNSSSAEIAPYAAEPATSTTGVSSNLNPTSTTSAPVTTTTAQASTGSAAASVPSTSVAQSTAKPSVKLPTTDVLQTIYKEVDAAARFFGDGGSLANYASKVAAISKKYAAYGLSLETGYENDKAYYYLVFGPTEYCLERVSDAGTLRAVPTSCP